MPQTDEVLAVLDRLAEAEARMTEGPWVGKAGNRGVLIEAGVYASGLRLATMLRSVKKFDADANADGIVLLRNAAPALIACARALVQARASAHPHPVEHPTMTAAWKAMDAALAELARVGREEK